jgi:hypothetical protein
MIMIVVVKPLVIAWSLITTGAAAATVFNLLFRPASDELGKCPRCIIHKTLGNEFITKSASVPFFLLLFCFVCFVLFMAAAAAQAWKREQKRCWLAVRCCFQALKLIFLSSCC